MSNKYVLFSPIGNHDPFGKTKTAVTEGPLLHIIRHYQPEVVLLFMTQEMYEKHKKDARYIKAINKLFPFCKIEVMEQGKDIVNAHNFDEFITPFNGIFENIQNNYPDYEIIFNVSSGTPQIISGLILEAQTSSIKTKAIQVITPQRKANIKDEYEDCDIEYIINEVETNDNRCQEPQFMAFKKMRLKSQLEILIKNYEYKSAIKLIEQEQNRLFSNEIIDLLTHANLRSNFDNKQATKYSNKKLDIADFEYFYTIKLKHKKSELMDMILKITPFVNNLLFKKVEQYYLKVFYADFKELITKTNSKNSIEEINRETIEYKRPELLAYLDNKFDGTYTTGFVKNITLKYIFDYLIEKIQFKTEKEKNEILQLSKKFNRLMDLEKNIRNKAAHEMISIGEAEIKSAYNGTSKDVIMDLEQILVITNKFPRGRFIYDDINEELLRLL